MAQTTVRISEATRAALRELAHDSGEPMQLVLEKAIESYRREQFLLRVNAGYAALRDDADAWSSHRGDLAAFDGALGDGLPAEASPRRAGAKGPRAARRR